MFLLITDVCTTNTLLFLFLSKICPFQSRHCLMNYYSFLTANKIHQTSFFSLFFFSLSPLLPIPIFQECPPKLIQYSEYGHTTPEEMEMITSSSHDISIHFRRGPPFFATIANCTFTSNFGYYSAIFPLLFACSVARLEVSIFCH